MVKNQKVEERDRGVNSSSITSCDNIFNTIQQQLLYATSHRNKVL